MMMVIKTADGHCVHGMIFIQLNLSFGVQRDSLVLGTVNPETV